MRSSPALPTRPVARLTAGAVLVACSAAAALAQSSAEAPWVRDAITSTTAVTSSVAPDAAMPGTLTATLALSPTIAPSRLLPTGPLALLLPDSEFVYGPTVYGLDVERYVDAQTGYLSRHVELVGDEALGGGQIVRRVAEDYSVGPRLLLTLIEMHSGWVRQATPLERAHPVPEAREGLHASLSSAAEALNAAYYAWRIDGTATVRLADGTDVVVAPRNAGTYAVLAYLWRSGAPDQLAGLETASRFATTWTSLFGDAYDFQVTDTLPLELPAEDLRLPFASGETWFYVGGPHPAWGASGPRAAIDLAPPPADLVGCLPSASPVRAAAGGFVTRSRPGGVAIDTDGDRFEGTGWVHVYAHLAGVDRIAAGKRVAAGDILGYASCDAGEPTLARVSIARKYNGEWIPVDSLSSPLVLGGWAALPGPSAGEGLLVHPTLPPRQAALVKEPATNGVAAVP